MTRRRSEEKRKKGEEEETTFVEAKKRKKDESAAYKMMPLPSTLRPNKTQQKSDFKHCFLRTEILGRFEVPIWTPAFIYRICLVGSAVLAGSEDESPLSLPQRGAKKRDTLSDSLTERGRERWHKGKSLPPSHGSLFKGKKKKRKKKEPFRCKGEGRSGHETQNRDSPKTLRKIFFFARKPPYISNRVSDV